MKDGDPRGTQQLAGRIKTRPVKDDVVTLPLPRRPRSIHQWRILPVDGSGLPIRIGSVLIGIQYLNFVQTHQEDAAVAAPWLSRGRRRFGKLDVQLAIAERLLRKDITGLRDNLCVAIFHFPFRRAAILMNPLGKIFAIEQNDRIGRRAARRVLRAGRAWVHHRRNGPAAIVNLPLGVNLGLRGHSENKQQYAAEQRKQ